MTEKERGEGSMGDAARGVDLASLKSVQNECCAVNGYVYSGSGAANKCIVTI